MKQKQPATQAQTFLEHAHIINHMFKVYSVNVRTLKWAW